MRIVCCIRLRYMSVLTIYIYLKAAAVFRSPDHCLVVQSIETYCWLMHRNYFILSAFLQTRHIS